MKSVYLRHLSFLAFAITLSACATQQPAPVIDGNSSGSVGISANPAPTAPSAPITTNYPVYTDNNTISNTSSNNPYDNYTPTPATHPVSYATINPQATHHTVVAGDTVYNISKRYGISQDQLRSLNGMTDNHLSLGQSLRIKPQSGSTAPVNRPSTSTSGSNTSAGVYHTVVAGDTVYNISKRYGISQDQLRSLNGMTDNHLSLGQRLRISGASKIPATIAQTPSQPKPAPIASGSTQQYKGIIWQAPLTNATVADPYNAIRKSVKLSAIAKQKVLAVADGNVILSELGPANYGNVVVIQHSDTPQYLSVYHSKDQILLKNIVHTKVKRGQAVAHIGDSGELFFQIRENSVAINPSSFIRF